MTTENLNAAVVETPVLERATETLTPAADTTLGSTATKGPRIRRSWWVAAAIAAVALVGGTVATVSLLDSSPTAIEAERTSGPAVGSQEFLNRLANQGYIPHEAVDQKLLEMERAVRRGDIPPESLDAPRTDAQTGAGETPQRRAR